MRLLIDTQALIWFSENNPFLTKKAREAIESDENDCLVSAASIWEMAIKISLGKLSLRGQTLDAFIDELQNHDFDWLDIRREHILEVEKLPFHHRDPFDRMLVGQSFFEKAMMSVQTPRSTNMASKESGK